LLAPAFICTEADIHMIVERLALSIGTAIAASA
jgi:hypothetical protein